MTASVILLLLVALAQSASSPRIPKFDLASIKPCNENLPPGARGGGGPGSMSPGRLNLNCQVVIGLIQAAYVMFPEGVRASPGTVLTTPIEGGPEWIRSERYTIDAKTSEPVGFEMLQGPMLQRLLEDRFKLKIRRDTREVRLYTLNVAKGGPRLPAFVEGSCVAPVMKFPPAPQPPLEPGQRRCALLGTMKGPNHVIDAEGITVQEFTDVYLSGSPLATLNSIVLNKTGLTGKYTFHLEYAAGPDDPVRRMAAGRGETLGESTAPEILTALQDQLGLRLEATKGPGPFLVIDHIERPAPDDPTFAKATVGKPTRPPARATGPGGIR